MFRTLIKYPMRCYLAALRAHILEALGISGFSGYFAYHTNFVYGIFFLFGLLLMAFVPIAFAKAYLLHRHISDGRISHKEIREMGYFSSIRTIARMEND